MTQLELNLVKDAKKKESFYGYVHQKRKVKKCVAPVIKKAGKLVTMNKEKAEGLNNFFSSVFKSNHSSHTF